MLPTFTRKQATKLREISSPNLQIVTWWNVVLKWKKMDGMTFEGSSTFFNKQSSILPIESKQSAAKNILLNRIFLGCYKERRYVKQLNEYRDVVTISSAEYELIADLDVVVKRLKGIFHIKWLGITVPEDGSCKSSYRLWVKLKNLPFGSFWFQIKEIKYENDEIILTLKSLRPVRPQDYEGAHKSEIQKTEDEKNSEEPAEYSFDFNLVLKIKMFYAFLNDTIRQVGPHLTWSNFSLVSKFIFALVFLIISGLLNLVRDFGGYFLRFMRELSFIIIALTPVFVQAIDFCTKVVGGLYILIALMFRGRGVQQIENQLQPQPAKASIPWQNFQR